MTRCYFGALTSQWCDREGTPRTPGSGFAWCDEHIPPSLSDEPVCPHGSLARSCQVCELAAEVRELRAELSTARRYLERWLCQHNEGGATDPCGVARELVAETAYLLGLTPADNGLG